MKQTKKQNRLEVQSLAGKPPASILRYCAKNCFGYLNQSKSAKAKIPAMPMVRIVQ